MILTGLILTAIPFLEALKPTAKAYVDLPRFKVPDLAPNSHIYLSHPLETQTFTAKTLVISNNYSERRYWYIPTIEGITAIPDFYSFRAGWKCYDLSPDYENTIIRCKDEALQKTQLGELAWDFDGKTINDYRWFPDLEPIAGKEIGDDFVLYHPDDEI